MIPNATVADGHDIRKLADEIRDLRQNTIAEIGKVVVGMEHVTQQFLIALLAGGHVLLEGVPGVAKTTLSKAFARVLGTQYQRIQFTPDLLPSDVTGTYVFDRKTNEFVLRQGPIFCQVLLADEVNRAPAKTQSALLEAMQEVQVTIEGTTLPLPRPFMVMATQNPVEQEGVYRLPEAQLDRFLIRVEMGYPGRDNEVNLLRVHSAPVEEPRQLFTAERILDIQRQLPLIHGNDALLQYIVDLAEASRNHPDLALGASPRASLNLLRCARARALLNGRHYFTHEDIHAIARSVLAHRLIIRPEAEVEGKRVEEVVDDLIRTVPVLETAARPGGCPHGPEVRPVLTRRAWWLLIASASMLAIGVISNPTHTVLWMVGLSAILWLTGEGLLFNFRARWVVRGLKLRRVVCDDRGPTKSLWAGRPFEVQLTLRIGEGMGLPYLAFEEPPPFALEVTEGETSGEGAIGPDQPLRASYRVKASRPGAARFEGVRIQIADLHGLFYHVGFVRLEAEYRILPGLVDAEGKTPASKRYNLLPPPGIHRLPRPGSGSELLDLRDYLPGDPPKTIAWKVSARRDKLITKEYESEVPVRCTLFVDVSQSVRLGPPGRNALTRLVEIAAGVAQANLASRDLTGLCLFDEEESKIIKPARTRRHLVQVFNDLADAAARPAAAGMAPIDPHLPLAYSYAREVYPELLADGVNHMPRWLSFLVPFPSHWVTSPTVLGQLYRILVLPLAGLVYLVIALLIILQLGDLYDEIPTGIREELLPEFDSFFIVFVILTCLFFPLWILLWRDAVPLLLSPRKRRLGRMRKKMAALLSERYALGGGGLELLLEDDRQLGTYLERFLNEHHVPHTPQLFDREGQYLFRSAEKLERLTAALMRSVGKGHDNELFVLFVDLVELEADLDPLLRAVKVTLSRHHQVFVVLPWPPDLPLPKRDSAGTDGPAKEKRLRAPRTEGGLEKIVNQLMARRYHQAFHRIRKTFARLQVPVVCAAEGDPIQLILDRLDRLRGLRRRRR